jgi:hypothetical protein
MTWSSKAVGLYGTRTWLVVALLAATMGIAGGQEFYPSRAGHAGTYLNPRKAPSRWDRAHFHRSGTRGRQGLGASPLHPEGPGNVTR